jgi:DNA-directed RNA polymerase subunit beta
MSSTAENQRVNFASIKNPLPYPDFLEVQLKSFQDFLQLDTPPEKRKKEGLYKVFAENFPIADTRNNFVLEFLDYYIDPPRYTIDECIARGLTYSVPLKAKLKLYCTDPDHEDFDTVIQDVYLGPTPADAERVESALREANEKAIRVNDLNKRFLTQLNAFDITLFKNR